MLSSVALKHYEKQKEKGESVFIDKLTYEEFKVLGDMELRRRFTEIDEEDQKREFNEKQNLELEHEGEKIKDKEKGGEKKTVIRKPFKGEDTIVNRIIHWDYSKEQIEWAKKAVERDVPMESILEIFIQR